MHFQTMAARTGIRRKILQKSFLEKPVALFVFDRKLSTAVVNDGRVAVP